MRPHVSGATDGSPGSTGVPSRCNSKFPRGTAQESMDASTGHLFVRLTLTWTHLHVGRNRHRQHIYGYRVPRYKTKTISQSSSRYASQAYSVPQTQPSGNAKGEIIYCQLNAFLIEVAPGLCSYDQGPPDGYHYLYLQLHGGGNNCAPSLGNGNQFSFFTSSDLSHDYENAGSFPPLSRCTHVMYTTSPATSTNDLSL